MKNYMGEAIQLFFKEASDTGTTAPVCIACATSCSINVNSDTISTDCKDSGKFTNSIAGKISYDISTDCLFCLPGTGDTRYGYTKLMNALVNGTKLKVCWSTVANFDAANALDDQNGEDGHVFTAARQQTSAKDLFWGECIVTSCSLTADNGALSTYSVSLQGIGKISSGSYDSEAAGE